MSYGFLPAAPQGDLAHAIFVSCIDILRRICLHAILTGATVPFRRYTIETYPDTTQKSLLC